MDDEEAVLNEIRWRYYPEKVLMQIEEKLEILPHLIKQNNQRTGFQIANGVESVRTHSYSSTRLL